MKAGAPGGGVKKTGGARGRAERGVAEALGIIRPEEWPGYVNDATHKHRWQHVAACRGRVAAAFHDVASVEAAPPAPAGKRKLMLRAVEQMRAAQRALAAVPWSPQGAARVGALVRELAGLADEIEAAASKTKRSTGNSAEARLARAQKLLAIRLAGELLGDFSAHRPTAYEDGRLRGLANLLLKVATGEEGGVRRADVFEYVKEDWSSFGKVKKPPTSAAKPSAELLSAIANDPRLKEREREWLQPEGELDEPAQVAVEGAERGGS